MFRSFIFPGVLASILVVCLAGPAVGQDAKGTAPAPSNGTVTREFAAVADEVLEQMSQITGLKLREPLKKTLRSRDEIRAYLVQQLNDDKNPQERYADTRAAEAFGLLPKNFDLDPFLIDLMTEQIAGLYDPKAREFYIADWIPVSEQKPVMAHELTHALEDQYFNLEAWSKAAKSNGDATMAREAVLEGSAMAAMFDYMLQGTGRSLKDLPDFDPSILMGDMTGSPKLQAAPQFIKDTLLFPYLSGFRFNAAAMKPAGWSSLGTLFSKPPVSTQQILHPALYKAGKTPKVVSVPSFEKQLSSDWIKLEDDTMGEFGWREVLKQFLDDKRAVPLAEQWEGDHYIVYEHKQTKKLVLATRIALASDEAAARFLGQYSEALEKKYTERKNLLRKPDYFSFDTPDGAVFLRCFGSECVTLEGTGRSVFAWWNTELKWPPLPEQPQKPVADPTKVARQLPPSSVPAAVAAAK
ncbi:MAG: hypothetical protein JSS69_09085 [Acidobacteria bacterium]|nr:hypothetical protein [Acidobacteriota bacterium]MBS1866059.1 hypothetical protein [Acidobacteriota bacterium]